MVKALVEVVEQDAAAAHAALGKLLHALQFLHVDLDLSRLPRELLQGDHVAVGVEQQRFGRQAVTSCAPDFLVVTLDVARHVAVDDIAHVALVDAHAEGDGGAHHLHVVVDEVALHLLLLLDAHAGMKGLGVDAQAAEFGGHLLGVLAAQAIDDAALVAVQVDELDNLAELHLARRALHDVQRDVGAVKRTDEQARLGDVQLLGDVVARDAVGGGRQGHHGDVGILLFERSQLGVFGTEIVAPLRDAVGLVDGKQADSVDDGARPAANLAQQFLGRDIQQLDLALQQQVHGLAVLAIALLTVQRQGGNAVLLQRVDLVVHQRQQGRDDDGKALIAHQAGNLVAQRLAATRRHQHDAVAAVQRVADDVPLLPPETVIAIAGLEQRQC